MIIFDTEFDTYFNKNIHMFLTSEFIESRDEEDKYDLLDLFFPDYMRREHGDECLMAAEDIWYWSGDNFKHQLDPLREYALFHFLAYIQDRKNDEPQLFDRIYYNDANEQDVIHKLWGAIDIDEYAGIFSTIKGFRRYMHDIDTLIGHCFEDIDFITFPEILGSAAVEERGGDEIRALANHYRNLLPSDIARDYGVDSTQRNDSGGSLFDIVGGSLDDLAFRLEYSGHHKPLWYKDMPMSEVDTCTYLDALLTPDARSSHAAIDREVSTGNGKVDFRFRRSPNETVLMEVKLANSPQLLSGLQKQLPHYMDALRCNQAYYLIVAYSRDELIKARGILLQSSRLRGKDICIKILDASLKTAPSKL